MVRAAERRVRDMACRGQLPVGSSCSFLMAVTQWLHLVVSLRPVRRRCTSCSPAAGAAGAPRLNVRLAGAAQGVESRGHCPAPRPPLQQAQPPPPALEAATSRAPRWHRRLRFLRQRAEDRGQVKGGAAPPVPARPWLLATSDLPEEHKQQDVSRRTLSHRNLFVASDL